MTGQGAAGGSAALSDLDGITTLTSPILDASQARGSVVIGDIAERSTATRLFDSVGTDCAGTTRS